jgi:K+-transporting ATPase ATPase C chain
MNRSKRCLPRAYNLAPFWVAAVALYGKFSAQLRPAIAGLISLTLLTGCLFPLALYAIAKAAFAEQAGGSLVSNHGVVVGSRLIGQAFSQPGYFHPRPSAAGAGYDGLASGGANLAPPNPKFFLAIREQAAAYRRENGLTPDTPVPTDAVTSSGSGLDPHISPEDAALQVPRVARARGLDEDKVRGLVAAHTEARQLGFLGEPRVSVLDLNLALDRAAPRKRG